MDNTIHSYGIKTMCWPCVDTWKKSRFVVNFHEVCVHRAPFSTISYCCVKQPLLVLFWKVFDCIVYVCATAWAPLVESCRLDPAKKRKTGQSILLGRGSKLVSHFYGVADMSVDCLAALEIISPCCSPLNVYSAFAVCWKPIWMV